jgi:hypothetical protein
MGQIKDKGRVIEYDGKSLEARNGGRTQLTVANEFYEHFNRGATIPPGLTLTEDGTPVAAATYGTGLGGTAVLTTDDVAAKQEALTTQLLWQADRQSAGQPLVFEAKWKAGATITTVEYWLGLTDAVADTAPIALSATSTFTTSVPTDGAYLGFSTTPTSGAAFTTGGNQHTAISIKADTNAVVATGGGAFAASTYYTYRIEVDAEGNAVYFVDGKLIGHKGGALTKTVPLAAIATVIPRASAGGAERELTLDYIYVGGK